MLLVIFYTIHEILQARILEWVAFPFSRESSQPRDWTQVSCIAGNSLPAEPQGKPKNTWVGSLSLLQGFFPSQELNQGLLHCRWILNQLSYVELKYKNHNPHVLIYSDENNSLGVQYSFWHDADFLPTCGHKWGSDVCSVRSVLLRQWLWMW